MVIGCVLKMPKRTTKYRFIIKFPKMIPPNNMQMENQTELSHFPLSCLLFTRLLR